MNGMNDMNGTISRWHDDMNDMNDMNDTVVELHHYFSEAPCLKSKLKVLL